MENNISIKMKQRTTTGEGTTTVIMDKSVFLEGALPP